MAQELELLRMRVAGTDFGPVITEKSNVSTTVWEEQPLTYREDEVSITEEEPQVDEVYSHENDDPEDTDVIAGKLLAKGTFINVTMDQLAELTGGTVEGSSPAAMYFSGADKKVLETAVRFRLKKGGAIIIPKAKGWVNTSAVMNAEKGLFRLPFHLECQSQKTFKSRYVIQETVPEP